MNTLTLIWLHLRISIATTFILGFGAMAYGQDLKGIAMTKENSKQQVMDFIKNTITAAKEFVFDTEAQGASVLKLQIVEVEVGKGEAWQSIQKRVITGVEAFDKNLENNSINFSVINRPDYLWGLLIKALPVCITQSEVEKQYGKPDKTYLPRTHDAQGRGTFEYIKKTNYGIYIATFEYRQAAQSETCLSSFSVQTQSTSISSK
jgi:hypothetical protein